MHINSIFKLIASWTQQRENPGSYIMSLIYAEKVANNSPTALFVSARKWWTLGARACLPSAPALATVEGVPGQGRGAQGARHAGHSKDGWGGASWITLSRGGQTLGQHLRSAAPVFSSLRSVMVAPKVSASSWTYMSPHHHCRLTTTFTKSLL